MCDDQFWINRAGTKHSGSATGSRKRREIAGIKLDLLQKRHNAGLAKYDVPLRFVIVQAGTRTDYSFIAHRRPGNSSSRAEHKLRFVKRSRRSRGNVEHEWSIAIWHPAQLIGW